MSNISTLGNIARYIPNTTSFIAGRYYDACNKMMGVIFSLYRKYNKTHQTQHYVLQGGTTTYAIQ